MLPSQDQKTRRGVSRGSQAGVRSRGWSSATGAQLGSRTAALPEGEADQACGGPSIWCLPRRREQAE